VRFLEYNPGEFVDVRTDAHHDVRRADQMMEALGGERGNLGERLARDQLRRQFGGDRDWRFTLRFPAGTSMPVRRDRAAKDRADQRERNGSALIGPRPAPAPPPAAKPLRCAADSASKRRRSASITVMVGFSPLAKSSSNMYLAFGSS